MKKVKLIILLALVFMASSPLYAEESYLSNLGHDLSRGLKNIVGSPLEIPIGIQKAHESAGFSGVRHFEGLIEGSFNTVKRFGSGVWDFVICWIPSDQEGLPLNPETLF